MKNAVALDAKSKATLKKKFFKKKLFVFLMLLYPLLQFAVFWLYTNNTPVDMTFLR